MTDETVIWKTNPDNLWRLFSHTDFKIGVENPAKDLKDQKEKKGTTTKLQTPTPFSFTKSKPFTKGSVGCTTKGYGIVQFFNEEKKQIGIKIDGEVHEVPQDEVFNEIPLNITLLNNSLKVEQTLYIPIHSTIQEMIERLEQSLTEGDGFYSINIFFRGMELSGSEETVEKLKIMPFSKILGINKLRKPLVIKRYTTSCTGWALTTINTIGIALMPTKTIRVMGFAVYKPSQSMMNAEAKLFSGSSINGTVLWTKSISVSETSDKDEITQIMFNKPYVVKEGEYCAIALTCTSNFQSNYGSGGVQIQEGEGDVSFTFKVCDDMPYSHGFDAGQIPEIYYYV